MDAIAVGYHGINIANINHINSIDSIDRQEKTQNDEQININPKRSDLSATIKPMIDEISTVFDIKKSYNEQINILKKVEKFVIKNESSSVEDFMKQFNFIEDSISEKQKKIQEDIIKSRDYFDGLYGAERLSPDEIIKQAQERMNKIKDSILETNKRIEDIQKEVNKKLNDEMIKSKEQAKNFQYNFGKESKDFSSNSVNNVAGSIVLSQANVNVYQIQKQVLY